MDEKESKLTEPTSAQASELVADFVKGITAHVDRQNKFAVAYANNFHFEPSTWDLKIIFGQLEQHTGKSAVDWHTAITIPWLQVKLVAYFLRLQAVWNEIQNGPINIPASVLPDKPQAPTGELASDPRSVAFYEASTKLYEETFGA
jgi:hypothetical protein